MTSITIYNLMDSWKEFYDSINIVSDTGLYKINEALECFLDVQSSHTEKIVGLCGKGTHILRRMKDLAMSNNENTECFIPNNKGNGRSQRPLWNIKHGYMYYKNKDNYRSLNKIILTINHINKLLRGYTLSEETNQNGEGTHGIIGIDIPFTEPQWLSDIVKGDPMFNPIVDTTGRIIFGKGATKGTTIDHAIQFLKYKSDLFNSLFPKYLNITRNEIDTLDLFIRSSHTVAIVGYGRHARVVFKDGENMRIIDAWKQEPDAGTKRLMKLYKNLRFVKRAPEQGSEGSCVTISLARALFTSHQGIHTIHDVIPLEYLVLSNRLVSKYR